MPASTMAPPTPTTTPITVLRVCGVIPVLPDEFALARSGVVVDTCSLVYVVDWPLAPVVVTTMVLVDVTSLGDELGLVDENDVGLGEVVEELVGGLDVDEGAELEEGVDDGVELVGVSELCGVDDAGVVETEDSDLDDVGCELELGSCELEESGDELEDASLPVPWVWPLESPESSVFARSRAWPPWYV